MGARGLSSGSWEHDNVFKYLIILFIKKLIIFVCRDPILTYKAGVIPGPFIQQSIIEMGEPVISETCPTVTNMMGKSVYLYVRCPPIQCGTVIETEVSLFEEIF